VFPVIAVASPTGQALVLYFEVNPSFPPTNVAFFVAPLGLNSELELPK